MDGVTFLPGITQKKISTGRLEVAYLEAGAGNPEPVVLIHGNVSCGWFFEELILELAKTNRYHLFAPDMRGYGATQTLPVDATRGVKDFAEDLFSFIQAVGLGQTRFFLLGWSLGGNVVMEYTLDHSETLRGLILESAGSPFGFGGTQGPGGAPNYSDFAGSGGGTANPEFVQRLEKGDRTGDAPVSPRNVMNAFYFKPPFKASAKIEETFVSAMLSTRVRPENYPGDLAASENWPGLGPGTKGVNNSISPKYLNQEEFANLKFKPPVLWVRGEDDQIVSDTSLFDLGMLGQLGAVPGWPGANVYPVQPMVTQVRSVLDSYQTNGGTYSEVVFPDCGHSPHIEKPAEFVARLMEFLGQN